ncbi:unnamed protein product [Linum tenue]|uniref:Cytochrome P450 n=1 Tax=Linum tenue TaxID=586396 RepID=A0AAV0JJF7_9ROSI|nr:unnamed protein product [Linum tenue]
MATITISFTILVTTSLLIISILTLLKRPSNSSSSSSKPPARLPPGPWALPVIGNLHQMAIGSSVPHRRLRDLAKQHGPLMRLRFGEVPIVVVSSAEWAKLLLQTHDVHFLDRPLLPAARIIFYGGRDMGFTPYGEYWRQMRKVCNMGLLGATRVKSLLQPTMEQEVSKLVAQTRAAAAAAGPINLSVVLFDLGSCVNSRVVLGMSAVRQEQVGLFFSLTKQLMKALGGFSLVDMFPSSDLLRRLTGAHAELKKLHAAVDAILETIISDHEAKRSSAAMNDEEEEEDQDLVDFLDILMAGTNTWNAVIEWALSEMLKNPRIMKKAQDEVRQLVFNGKGDIVDEACINQLHYLQLVVTETLRLHPSGPLNVPRENQETVVIQGYRIPAKKRFLNTCTDYKGLHFQFIPFGAGRRMCPGVHYGTTIAKLVLANLLYHFDWELANGVKPQDLDMEERLGLDLRRKNDLVIIPIPYHHQAA